MPRPPHNPVTDLTAAVPVDDALRARALELLNAAIDESFTMLRTGSPSTRLNVIKAIMPAIGRAAAKTEITENDELDDLRTQLEELTRLITGTSSPAPVAKRLTRSDVLPSPSK